MAGGDNILELGQCLKAYGMSPLTSLDSPSSPIRLKADADVC